MVDNLEKFIAEWFPKTEEWQNVGKFILESGIELTDEVNPKWLTGYTNIGRSYKPHHKDEYIRYMEESMFMLHDCVHQIFTLDTQCSEEVYIKRQIYGELFTFYLTEYIIPRQFDDKHQAYIGQRGCYDLICVILGKKGNKNIIDFMWQVFIDNEYDYSFFQGLKNRKIEDVFEKYSKMFQEDLHNSRKNYKFVPNVPSYCMVGSSSQNHIDFFEVVKKGAIKNIKREFNLKLPTEWI